MRKSGLVSSLWAALLLFSSTIFALGLGEIEVGSFLNQPLKAKIEVISARPGEIDDLLISLASRNAFDKAGLERPAVLSKLKFRVDKSEDGQSASVFVTTKTPVTEPFLSFLVEADWAKGRLLREYTVLLDPPSFAQQAVSTTPEPQAIVATTPSTSMQTEPAPIASRPVTTPTQQVTQAVSQPVVIAEQPARTETPQTTTPVAGGSTASIADTPDQIIVNKGDTLWGIASQFKDADHSMAQVMLALQMMNPEAFGQDNINNLKVGAVLRVPELNTLDNLSKQEAYAQVLEQNGLWDEYVARKSAVASTASPAPSIAGGAAQADETARLSLLAPGDGESENASLQTEAGGDDAGKIRKQLALAEEELEAARLENEDLTSRIKSLEAQLSKFEELQKMVQIQDDSLAQLQNTASEDAAAEATSDMMEATTGDVTEQDVAQQQETVNSEADDAPSEIMVEAASEILAQEQAAPVAEAEQTPQQADMMDDNLPSTEAETVLPTTTVEEPALPAPAIITAAPESALDGGIMDMVPSLDELLNDPVMLGGMGGILALILAFILIRKKKSAKEEETGISIEVPESVNLDDDATPIHIPSSETADDEGITGETDIDMPDTEQHMAETLVSEAGEESEESDEEDEFSKTAVISSEDLGETQEMEPAQEQDDVLNEVDVYLAYGLYDNAEDLLKESLENSPQRADYRAKLLDTHFATKNTEAFIKEAEILKSLGGAADRFWDRVQVMGFELAPDNELFSGAKDSGVSVDELEFAKPDTPDFDIGSDDEVTDFSNTDFNLGEETMDVAATQVLDATADTEEDFSSTRNLDDLDVEFPDLDDEVDEQSLDESHDDDAEIVDLAAELDLVLEDEASSDNDEILLDENESNVDLDLDEEEFEFDLMENQPESEDLQDVIDLESTLEAPSELDQQTASEGAEDNMEIDFDESGLSLESASIDESDGKDNDTQQLDEEQISETVVVAPVAGENELVQGVSDDLEMVLDDDLDFDMSDMDDAELRDGAFTPSETVALADVSTRTEDDITEFRPAEMNDEFDSENVGQASVDEVELDPELAATEVDATSGLDKTGTFAPGDFDEGDITGVEVDQVEDITGIEDLMLPDDVDEVATKLDLAKAFIDMGDAEGARSSLEEVLSEGSDEQKAEASGLLEQIK